MHSLNSNIYDIYYMLGLHSHFIDTIFCYLFLAFLRQNLIYSLIPILLSYFAQGC